MSLKRFRKLNKAKFPEMGLVQKEGNMGEGGRTTNYMVCILWFNLAFNNAGPWPNASAKWLKYDRGPFSLTVHKMEKWKVFISML